MTLHLGYTSGKVEDAIFILDSPPVTPPLGRQDEAIFIHDSPPMAPPPVNMKEKLDDAVSIQNSSLPSALLDSNFSIMAGVFYILMTTRFNLFGCFSFTLV